MSGTGTRTKQENPGGRKWSEGTFLELSDSGGYMLERELKHQRPRRRARRPENFSGHLLLRVKAAERAPAGLMNVMHSAGCVLRTALSWLNGKIHGG